MIMNKLSVQFVQDFSSRAPLEEPLLQNMMLKIVLVIE